MGSPSHMDGPHLVDAHVHIKNPEGIASIASAGIAAARDAGMKGRPRRDADMHPHSRGLPIVVSAEWALYQRGGYGSLLGADVDTPDEIKSEILKLRNAGAGIIKAIASGLVSLTEPDQVTPGGFNGAKLSFIVGEAGRLGLDVMAHANGKWAIMAAVEAGVRSIEHGFFMTLPALERMAKKRIFWTPTVGALARAADAAAISIEMRSFVTKLIQSHIEMIGRAYKMGVPMAVGTDCVLPDPNYAQKYRAELSYFEQAGISREDAMKIACEGGAKLLRLKT